MGAVNNVRKHFFSLMWGIENAELLKGNYEYLSIKSPVIKMRSIGRTFIAYLVPKKETGTENYKVLNIEGIEKPNDFPMTVKWGFLDRGASPVPSGTLNNPDKPDPNGPEMSNNFKGIVSVNKGRSKFFSQTSFVVLLQIWMIDGDLPNSEFIFCRSQLEILNDAVLWEIKGFSDLQLNQELSFPMSLDVRDNFVMTFSLQGKSLQNSSATIKITPKLFAEGWEVRFRVHVLDSQKNFVSIVEDRLTERNQSDWTLPPLTSRKELLKSRSKMLKNDTLNLRCELEVLQKKDVISESFFNLPYLRDIHTTAIWYANKFSKQSVNRTAVSHRGVDSANSFPTSVDSSTQTSEQCDELTITSFQTGDSSRNKASRFSASSNQTSKQSVFSLQAGNSSFSSGKINSALSDSSSSQISVENRDSSPIGFQERKSLGVLVEDFANLSQDEILSDFEIRSGQASFRVHKNILGARCLFFKDMFSRNTRYECTSNVMHIRDLDSNTLLSMLTFLYTGNVRGMDWRTAVDLYYAAYKYQVLSLTDNCVSFLRANTTCGNVWEILLLSDIYCDTDLKKHVHDFILSHYDDCVSSPEWATFKKSYVKLGGETMHQVNLKKLETL